MRNLFFLVLLVGSETLYSQTITPGVYGPAKPVMGGASFHFKENNICEVCFFSCTSVGFGLASYTLHDSFLTLKYIPHPGDTLKPLSSIRYSGKAVNDSIDIVVTVLRKEEGIYYPVFPNGVTANSKLMWSLKKDDSTHRFYCRLPISELPFKLQVRAKATYTANLLINQPQNADIKIYSPYSEYIDMDFIEPGEESTITIQSITPEGFDVVYYNGERRTIPFVREDEK